MKIDAIVFKSKTGYSKKYAELISEELNVKSLELEEAKNSLSKDSKIIYVGSLMANQIVGESEAKKYFEIVAILANGMTEKDKINIEEIKKTNELYNLPIFYARGGLDLKKLNFFEKFIMKKIMIGEAKKQSSNKEEFKKKREIALRKQDFVSKENLNELFKWCSNN